MGPFPQSFLSIVCLDQDMYLGRYDLSWPYDVHLVTLMVWSKMAEYWQVTVFPILSIWDPCSSHFSALCAWTWTFVPRNQACYGLIICILWYILHKNNALIVLIQGMKIACVMYQYLIQTADKDAVFICLFVGLFICLCKQVNKQ